MEALKNVWDFFQNEVLGMGWLNRLIPTTIPASQSIFMWWERVGCVTLISSNNLQAHFSPERSNFIILIRFSSQNALKIVAVFLSSIS